jgi:hypothetical protein
MVLAPIRELYYNFGQKYNKIEIFNHNFLEINKYFAMPKLIIIISKIEILNHVF